MPIISFYIFEYDFVFIVTVLLFTANIDGSRPDVSIRLVDGI